jgi:hypothetical protein
MSKRLFCIGFALVLLCAINAQAVPLTWYLQGVTFADGSTASGSFVFDADANSPLGTYGTISITTTTGATVTANSYIYLNPNVPSFSLQVFPVTTTGSLAGTPELDFHFTVALTDAGGTVPLTTSGPVTSGWVLCADAKCFNASAFVDVTAGVVTTAPPTTASTYFTTYYSANQANAPDEAVRIINDGSYTAASGGAPANLFAAIYVFDDSEELTQCCNCQVTPDGLLSESVKLNLTANPIRNIVNSRGVIKVISSTNAATLGAENPLPQSGLRVWATHIQGTKVTLSPGNPVNPVVASPYFATETEAARSNLAAAEQTLLGQLCYFDRLLSGKPCTCQPEDFDF